MEILRLIIGYAFLLAGLILFIIEMAGVFKLDYALNRMHAAAIGDSFALALSMIGLIIINGINFVSFKLAELSIPMEPVIMLASSERMSPNMFSVRITSNCAGSFTSCIAQLSTNICSRATSG